MGAAVGVIAIPMLVKTEHISRKKGPFVDNPVVDFGIIQKGQIAETRVRIVNPTTKTIYVRQADSSCPCLSISEPIDCIGPRQEVAATIRLDMSHEPEFSGGLLMSLCLVDIESQQKMDIRAQAQIR
jgi:hypothetical protein